MHCSYCWPLQAIAAMSAYDLATYCKPLQPIQTVAICLIASCCVASCCNPWRLSQVIASQAISCHCNYCKLLHLQGIASHCGYCKLLYAIASIAAYCIASYSWCCNLCHCKLLQIIERPFQAIAAIDSSGIASQCEHCKLLHRTTLGLLQPIA